MAITDRGSSHHMQESARGQPDPTDQKSPFFEKGPPKTPAQTYGDLIGNPLILTQFVGFALFLVAAQAELTQPPFDMPVAESELVAGYMVEYTGFRFLFFFIGEFGTAFAFAALAATLFLGGWSVPWVHGTAADFLGPIVLFAKVMFVAFLMFWARFTYPRFRDRHHTSRLSKVRLTAHRELADVFPVGAGHSRRSRRVLPALIGLDHR